MQEKIKQDSRHREILAEDSVSFFHFPKDLSIAEFKKKWHKNLNEIICKLNIDEEQSAVFVNKLIDEANFSIKTITGLIESMLVKLSKGVY